MNNRLINAKKKIFYVKAYHVNISDFTEFRDDADFFITIVLIIIFAKLNYISHSSSYTINNIVYTSSPKGNGYVIYLIQNNAITNNRERN